MEGILATIKKARGISQEDDSFDADLLLYINTTLVILAQLGLKEAENYPIVTESSLWTDLLGDRDDLEIVKSHIDFKVKLMFDPPSNSAAMQACNNLVSELEWRIANLDVNKGVRPIEPSDSK